jgi:hypothetical protein
MGGYTNTQTNTHGQQRDLISLHYFFQNKESRLKIYHYNKFNHPNVGVEKVPDVMYYQIGSISQTTDNVRHVATTDVTSLRHQNGAYLCPGCMT